MGVRDTGNERWEEEPRTARGCGNYTQTRVRVPYFPSGHSEALGEAGSQKRRGMASGELTPWPW